MSLSTAPIRFSRGWAAVGLYPGGEMSAYQTLVVGTDGSDTSLRAVDHAAAFAAALNAKLIIAMAHLPNVDKGGWGRPARPDRVIDGRAEVLLRGEGDFKMHGMSPNMGSFGTPATGPGRLGRRISRRDRFRWVVWVVRHRRCPASPRRSRPICWWLATWDWAHAPTSGLARCPATSCAGPRPTCWSSTPATELAAASA